MMGVDCSLPYGNNVSKRSLPAHNSLNRDRVFKELLSVVSRHGELSLYEKRYLVSLLQHKLSEMDCKN